VCKAFTPYSAEQPGRTFSLPVWQAKAFFDSEYYQHQSVRINVRPARLVLVHALELLILVDQKVFAHEHVNSLARFLLYSGQFTIKMYYATLNKHEAKNIMHKVNVMQQSNKFKKLISFNFSLI
jgi:hypothetical protein